MLAIHSVQYDVNGVVFLDLDYENTSFGDASRRRSRVQTLDGGWVTEDRGYSEQDTSFQLAFRANKAKIEEVKRLVELYPRLIISSDQGCFLCSVDKLVESITGVCSLNVDVEQKYA